MKSKNSSKKISPKRDTTPRTTFNKIMDPPSEAQDPYTVNRLSFDIPEMRATIKEAIKTKRQAKGGSR